MCPDAEKLVRNIHNFQIFKLVSESEIPWGRQDFLNNSQLSFVQTIVFKIFNDSADLIRADDKIIRECSAFHVEHGHLTAYDCS